MKINLKTNIVFENLVDSDKKIVINQGGTRSGKTFNILLYIIFYYCLNNSNKTITICRKTYQALRATVFRDFINNFPFIIILAHSPCSKCNCQKNK